MENLDFDVLKGDKKIFYEHLWNKNSFDFNTTKIGKNDCSYRFKMNDSVLTAIGNQFAEIFGINDKKLFLEKFKQACSGNGNELGKITTLHSSSLCSLLFFYNPRNLVIKGLEDYEFEKSIFEFKNKVIRYPSNIDVVLLGKNKETNKKAILFLESKFSEFIFGITKAGSKFKIGKSYFSNDYSKTIYDESNMKKLGFELNKDDGYITSSENAYIEGIKQMISHYVGVRNFMVGEFYEKDNENLVLVKKYLNSEHEILLGEILFDNLPSELKCYLDDYEGKYQKLAKILNNECKDKENLQILEKPLHYSIFKDNSHVEEKIRSFYFGNL